MIGSVHCVKQGDAACYVDESAQASQRAVDEYFGGDWYRYTDAYYDLVADLPERPGASGSATLTWSPSSMNRPIPSMRTVPGICAGHWKRWSTWSNRVWPLRSTPGLWPVATAPHLTPQCPAAPAEGIWRRNHCKLGLSLRTQLCFGFDQAAELAQAAGFTHTNLWTRDACGR